MRGLRRVVCAGLVLGAGLGCAGIEGMIPQDPSVAAPIEDAEVAALLDAEDPDRSRTPDERAARATAVTAYLASTADFAPWRPAVMDCLAARTATTTEDCHARARSDFAEKPPAEVAVESDDWKVVVVVSHTFQDNTWSTAGESTLATLDGVDVVHAPPGVRSVSVKLNGNEVGPIDFSAQVPAEGVHRGWILGRAGTDFKLLPETADVGAEAPAFYGLGAPEPAPVDPGAATPAPGSGARTGGSRTAPAPEPVVEAPAPAPAPAPVPVPEPDEELPDRVDLDTPAPAKAGKGKAGKVKGGKNQ